MPIKTIVAALALEEDDDPVAGRALQLAQQHGARLIIVHVIEDWTSDAQDVTPPADPQAILDALQADARARLTRRLKAAPAAPEIVVEAGRPHAVIDAVARRCAADLIVIGAGKARNVRERVFGSTADRVVRSAARLVLVVKTPATDAYRRIVAGVDFSSLSLVAARSAARLAPGAALSLIHAVEIPLSFEAALLKTGTPQAEIDRYRRAKVRAAQQRLRALISTEAGLPDDLRPRVISGSPRAVLIRSVNRGGVDLIALGAQGASAVSRLVLGSVARAVLKQARSDILIAPAPSDA